MNVQTLVESVYLRVNGGKPTTEDAVMRSDIRVLVPDAVNAVMAQFYNSENDEVIFESSPLFLQVFESVPVAINTTRGKFEFELPKRPLSVSVNKSVRSVGLDNGVLFEHFYPEDGTLRTFYIQTNRDLPAYSVEGNNVVLYNFPLNEEEVLVKQLVHIDDYTDGDEIILPSGTDSLVIDTLFEKFVQQRSIPSDSIINGNTP